MQKSREHPGPLKLGRNSPTGIPVLQLGGLGRLGSPRDNRDCLSVLSSTHESPEDKGSFFTRPSPGHTAQGLAQSGPVPTMCENADECVQGMEAFHCKWQKSFSLGVGKNGGEWT